MEPGQHDAFGEREFGRSPFHRPAKIWTGTAMPSVPVANSTAKGSSTGSASPASSRSSRRTVASSEASSGSRPPPSRAQAPGSQIPGTSSRRWSR
ncbi:hypothetical protein [Streptomyces sp. NBC_01294]|uniref:hypothetical protein n=1 Tax=Streptomyces sp. NBC_01294 TaxID=2903815 RepID=UPI002DDB56F9|nr:hypothetical protein [Streptomyces sp. NBC_01294]WRZ61589.1 hypothetical protein OG534_37075 [Streptomyces sp. NBC_01294]